VDVDDVADDWQASARAPVEAADDDLTVIRRSGSDPERFAVLVRRHSPAVGRYVTRRIGQERAEDVVAETFLVAFRKRGDYRDQGRDCLPWLYGIATRLMHRERRNEVRQLRLLAASGADPVTAPFTDRVEDAVAARGVKQRLAAAMAELPVSQRDALLLLVWADLSYEQIATATGVPLGTVQSRISRARRRLRESLADLDPAVPIGD
jgi:RNA polymerase sigma-70 factor (ECF subfamily)